MPENTQPMDTFWNYANVWGVCQRICASKQKTASNDVSSRQQGTVQERLQSVLQHATLCVSCLAARSSCDVTLSHSDTVQNCFVCLFEIHRNTQYCKRYTPWRSTHTIPRRSLLPRRHTLPRYTCQSNFILPIRKAWPSPRRFPWKSQKVTALRLKLIAADFPKLNKCLNYGHKYNDDAFQNTAFTARIFTKLKAINFCGDLLCRIHLNRKHNL